MAPVFQKVRMYPLNIDRVNNNPRGLGIGPNDDVGLFAGNDDPRLIDEGVPVSSLYFRTDGTIWQKVAQPNDWLIIKPGYKAGQIPIVTADGQEIGVQIEDTKFSVVLADGSVATIN
jgi:hypothetical protein